MSKLSGTSNFLQSQAVFAFLSESSSYPDDPKAVEIKETHISWVFLTNRFAYKLKKPVRFEFLNFTTPELRHQACLAELRLNRRLAPDVYLAVLPIVRGTNGRLELNGRGSEVDWVVKMRRLAADQALDVRLHTGQLALDEAQAIAEHLADFYAQLPPERLAAASYRRVFDRHIRANGAVLANEVPEERARIERIQGAELRYLYVAHDEFKQRVAGGRIVEGHGDLRPEHIYLETPPAIIDCIEFSDKLRRIDIADELSFLAMECDHLGSRFLGDLVLSTYASRCGDHIPSRLLKFYRCYRACVRAKVNALRIQQDSTGRRRRLTGLVRQYLDWADRYAAELGRPSLLFLGGLMGTGKSSLAARLAYALGMEMLSTDHVRRSMLGCSSAPAGYAEGNYTPDTRDFIYEQLLRQAADVLCQGRSVILDGTFLTRNRRAQTFGLASRHHAVALYVVCNCPRKTALARIAERARAGVCESEARPDLYDHQVSEFRPPGIDEPHVAIDTTQRMSRQMLMVCDELRRQLFDGS